jgi:hypothetical protein
MRVLRFTTLLFAAFSSPLLVEDSLAQGGRFAFGFGSGSATIWCSACRYNGNVGGTTAMFQFNSDPTTLHLRFGVSSDWWWHSGTSPQGWDRWTITLAPSVFYYPWTVRNGFFLEAGPALVAALARVTDSTALRRHGWGFTLGVGYDVAPRWKVSLTPRLAFTYAWVGDIYYPLGSNVLFARGWRHEVLSLGLGITLHQYAPPEADSF